MNGEVYLQCPHRQSILITNIVYETKWNIFKWRSFNPLVCKTWTNTWNDCKYSISYQPLQDQCIGEDTCTVMMNYNPCSSVPLLYATIYYECSESRYETIVPLIKYYSNGIPTSTSTQKANNSPNHKHKKKDDDDDDDDDDDKIHNESQNNKSLKICLGTAVGITSLIAIIALLCILKSRRNKHEQRPNPMARSNHLNPEYNNGFENSTAYQISATNPTYTGYSQTRMDRVDTSRDINYALPSYEEAVSNPYDEVNYRTSK
ncbi:uncharacterized protein LOC134693419 [Mytilus trossulus]|uniref:uncharacterized protein LOC134693419 n=1 Tax=Mytilus trossulus TaxID=6551 RepID=UPI0030043F2C